MNKKGFTLIELVGAIVIIAILALMAFPALVSMLNKGQTQVDDSVKDVIKSAAADCVNENINDYRTVCGNPITICKLRNNGYISTTFYDKYSEDIEKATVTVSGTGSNYSYTYNSNGNPSGCS